MRSHRFSVVAFVLTGLLAWAAPASAEWSELVKEEEATYYFDKEAVMPVHVSRYAWVLTDLPKAEKTPTGETYKSMMLRVRMYCKNDRKTKCKHGDGYKEVLDLVKVSALEQ